MRTVAIIQARMDSERLPGKVLEKIGDATVLAWVVYRTRQIKLDQIVVATTGLPSDDRIVEECGYLDVECYRGSADDVVGRYYKAAVHYGATHILRVTADSPMLSPSLNQFILNELVERPGFDYMGSIGWPDGVGQEAFTFKALERTAHCTNLPFNREHVVPYMLKRLTCGFVQCVSGFQDAAGKLSIDTEEDLRFLRHLYGNAPERFERVSAG